MRCNFLEIGVIVLAGGSSVRMGGTDKAFMLLDGKPLLRWTVDRSCQVTENVMVVVGKKAVKERYSAILPPSVSIVEDESDKRGPVVGLFTGLRNLNVEYAGLVPCDIPFLNPEVLKFLFEKAEDSEATIPLWANGYIEPLQAVYFKASVLPAASETLNNNELSIRDLIKRLLVVRYVPIDDIRKIDPDLDTFFNVNNPGDLEKASLIIKRKKRRRVA